MLPAGALVPPGLHAHRAAPGQTEADLKRHLRGALEGSSAWSPAPTGSATDQVAEFVEDVLFRYSVTSK